MRKLIQFEVRKIFSKRLTRAMLVFVLLLSILYSVSTYQNMHASDGIGREGSGHSAVAIDQSIANKYEGILTDEKVQQMLEDFRPQYDLNGLNPAYLYLNATQSSVFARFVDLNGDWNGLTVSDVFGEEEIKIGYTYGWLQTSQNLVRIFLVLSVSVAIMIAPVFSSEYGGVDQLILTSRYGKTKCTTAKVIASLLAALLVTAIVAAFHLIFALALYGKSGLDCSILFAPVEYTEGFIPFNITCGTLMGYQILLAFTGVISVTGITLLLSAVCKSQLSAAAVSAAIYILPALFSIAETHPLFKIVTLLPLYHAQFFSLMSVAQLRGGVLYALLAVPVSLILMGVGSALSRKIFAGHS